jgi:CBS domain-containing protein
MEARLFSSERAAICWDAPLSQVLQTMGAKKRYYRGVIVDGEGKFKGILSARRILEVIMGKRGVGLKEENGFRWMLHEPVSIFTDESHQIFPEDVGTDTVLKYMSENLLGYVVLVNEVNAYRGIVEEINFLEHLKGKTLGIRVADIMRSEPVIISHDATMRDAADKMLKERVRRLPIVKDSRLTGMITVNDVIRHLLSEDDGRASLNGGEGMEGALSDCVEAVASREVISCSITDDAGEVARMIVDMEISGLPVLSNEGRLVGIASRIDIVAGAVRMLGVNSVLEMMK